MMKMMAKNTQKWYINAMAEKTRAAVDKYKPNLSLFIMAAT